jgi:hypothetical protein
VSVDDGLRPLFRKHLIGFHWQSVETGSTGGGVPDSNYCRAGQEGWIEFKATGGYVVDLKPFQIGWICARVRHGGRVWIGVRRRNDGGPRRGKPVDELWLIPGVLAVEAKTTGLKGMAKRKEVMHWDGGPSAWRWDIVADRLVA